MLLVRLRLLPVFNTDSNGLRNTESTKAHTQRFNSDATETPTKRASRPPKSSKTCEKGKRDDAPPTFVINGIKYREEPYVHNEEGGGHAEMLMLTEEDIAQMRKEFQADRNDLRTDGRPSVPSLHSHIPQAEETPEPGDSLELNTQLELVNEKRGHRENLGQTPDRGTEEEEEEEDGDVEEVIVPLELCVTTPFVDEIWDNWPRPAHIGAPGAALFSPTLSLEKVMKVCSNAFLCIYSTGYVGCLSLEAETVVCASVMRLLRCRLLSLLQGLGTHGDGGILHTELKEVLQRYCVVSGNACRVRWHPLLVQGVARTFELNPAIFQAQYQCNAKKESSTEGMDTERKVPLPANDTVVVPQAGGGMEPWSDDDEAVNEDGSLEERIIRASRRQVASKYAYDSVTSFSTMPPVVEEDDNSRLAFAPFIVHCIDPSQTCLPLLWSWRHRESKGPKKKNIALQVTIDSLTAVRQSRRDKHAALRLIDKLYNSFLLIAERHRESGNSDFLDLDASTASVNDYEIVLQSYEKSALLAQRGITLPYKIYRLSQGFHPTTTPARIDGKHEIAQESRKSIYSVLENLSETISDDTSQNRVKVTVPAEDLQAKYQVSTYQGETVSGTKSLSGSSQRHSHYRRMEMPGVNYFNEALLRIHLDGETDFSSPENELSERINMDPIFAPARAAMGPNHTTTLYLILYMLRRQLVASTANAALVALRIYALQHDKRRTPSWNSDTCDLPEQSTSQTPSRWSIQLIERYAKPCDGASELALELLRWNTLSADTVIKESGTCPSSMGEVVEIPARVQEVLWCVRMYVKLRLRGLRLWGCAGNQYKKQALMRDLREVLELWDRQRRRHMALQAPQVEKGIESFFATIPEAAWQALLEDVRITIAAE